MVVDDAGGVEPLHNGLSAQREVRVVAASGVVVVVLEPVDQVGVHVFAVAGGVVAHAVGHHGRVVLRGSDVELGVPGVAVGRIGVGGLPVVVGEVRLRKR